MTIPAKYENGVFKPLEDLTIEEGTAVESTCLSGKG
jgi:predicted DNA-binding antitoxin AbrB/MazE fold protein